MRSSERCFVLFPHQVIPEQDLGRLALIVPKTHRIQVLEPLTVPAWCAARFEILPAGLTAPEAEQLRHARESFREFAAVHQNHCLAASFTSETFLRQDLESRLDIQSTLRRGEAEKVDKERKQLLEAALFLEMAAEFDRKQGDLASDLSEAAQLEAEFREILGIGEEDTLEDSLETLSPPLTPTRTYLSFMLDKRIAGWLRVFSRVTAPSAPLTLVALTQEVVDEIIDRIDAWGRKRDPRPDASTVPPVPVPCIPAGIASDAAAGKLESFLRSDAYVRYEKSLGALLDSPLDAESTSAFVEAAEGLAQATEAVFGPSRVRFPAVQLVVTTFTGLSLADLKEAMDPGGPPPPPDWAQRPAPPILCLRESLDIPLTDDDREE